MITYPAIEKSQIRTHYNLATLFYWLLWGRHIHHGYWKSYESKESNAEAQQQLIEQLAQAAQVEAGQRVLDVGCGMGGSAIHLARTKNCRVTGITLSPFQRRWAEWSARWHHVSPLVDFHCQDAELAEFPQEEFDLLWSIECTEHLFDKPGFFQRAAHWVKPGGYIAICAWLARDTSEAPQKQLALDVCRGMLCPSLGTKEEYAFWIQTAGFQMMTNFDWTFNVIRTWEICKRRAERTGVRYLARLLDKDLIDFLDRFQTMIDAFNSGAMSYGCLVARRAVEV